MRRGSVTLGDLTARIAMLEVACSRCGRRGRLQVDLLVAQYGDAELPELRLILAGDCPRAAVVSISDQCDIFFPQRFTSGATRMARRKARAISPSSSRSRFLVNTVTSQTGASMDRPTNQRNSIL